MELDYTEFSLFYAKTEEELAEASRIPSSIPIILKLWKQAIPTHSLWL
jgi:hypothetical protein